MNWLKRLWADEPVIVRTLLALAVSAGVLTGTQASGLGDAISGIVVAVAALSARSAVKPAKAVPDVKPAPDAGTVDVALLLIAATLAFVLLLFFRVHA